MFCLVLFIINVYMASGTADAVSRTLKAQVSTLTPVTTTLSYISDENKYSSVNVTGTPLQYIGIGYNLLTGNPELSTDPGFKTAQRIFQLTGYSSSVREVEYKELAACTPSKVTTLIHGSKSYQNELLQFVQPSSNHSTSLKTSALTYSPAFQSFKQSLETINNVYIDYISSCNFESARYMTELADKNNFTVTKEFAKDVCALPADGISTTEYAKFLDKWGTSIVIYVNMGVRTIDRYKTTPDQILQYSQQMAPEILKHTGTYQGYKSSISINPKDFVNSSAASNPFGTRHTISLGTKQQSIPIALQVVPISDALNWIYWEPISDELIKAGICSDSIYGTRMKQYAMFIKTALSEYVGHTISQTGIPHNQLTDHNIQVPISWPVGTYGLMQTTHGCPGGKTIWLSGWRKYDTEDLGSDNSFSANINHFLKGDFDENDIKTYFCIKSSAMTHLHSQTWQNGAYCLLKHGSCPLGFTSGYIFWDDEDLHNDNAKWGTLPDGTYDKNTKMYYCCRNDGSPQIPLLLPTERPFALVRYGSKCQSVHGMNVRDVYAHWDDEDLNNKDSAGGMHPLDEGGSKNHQLHFCYYFSSSSPSVIG
ncbi:uncharacterized protein LOC123535471 [Mercenaria mercenaria]|uniref:uncharacterized protein LOC123535471 n=1 Tax=Mercenaria mercenaria TaxID=6596 RepID=UPI00234F342B|nr:uncharacterized protein LOC123535471 [Mercenaria mercenaria]